MPPNNEDKLLGKNTVVPYLEEIEEKLSKHLGQKKDISDLIYQIGEIIGEARCCINNWSDVSHFYRWSCCILRRSLEFLEHNDHRETQNYIRLLEQAHNAVRPLVIAQIEGTGDKTKLKELGFL